MTVPQPAMLAEQLSAGPARIAVGLWPQIMAAAREHLIPWIDENVPELAATTRLAFHDLDIVADELRQAVTSAWQRLRAVLIAQTVQFTAAGNGEWAIRITSRLRDPAVMCAPVAELTTEAILRCESLLADSGADGLAGFQSASLDIARIRDDLLSRTSTANE
jgi:hypothetical protein